MAETPCENTVAMAAPATPQPSTRMQNKSSRIFSTVERSRNQNGVLLSPNARIILEQIIEESKGNPDKRDKQVIIGSREYVLRRTHHVQNICTVNAGNHGNDNRHHRSQLQADSHITAHRDIIPRTELLRHGNAETSATAIAESQNKKNDRSACPD